MRIAVAQLYTSNFDHWAYIAKENKQEYCDRHGYSLVTKKGLYNEGMRRHPSWHSILLIKEILETTDVDWVFWSDIDALIMDHRIGLEGFIKPDCDMIIPNQGRGITGYKNVNSCLCCGNYFIKNTDWSKDLLQEVWDWPHKYNKREFLKCKYWEQCAMNYMWNNNIMDFNEHTHIERCNRAFNSFYSVDLENTFHLENKKKWSVWGEELFDTEKSGMHYARGDFILHFAGHSGKGNIKELIEKYSKLARR